MKYINWFWLIILSIFIYALTELKYYKEDRYFYIDYKLNNKIVRKYLK